jgi:hypothetical protein
MMENMMDNAIVEKPVLLKAIEIVLADPKEIKKESLQIMDKIRAKYPDKDLSDIQRRASDKIISNYSYFSAFSGGATALSGVVPGLGTAVAMTGGAAADVVTSMKFQIEMTMAIAAVYGHNIELEEEKRICYLIAGLGAISEAAKEGGKSIGSKAFIKIVQENLKGATLTAVKEVFKKVGITFARSSLQKAIPFGVGVVIGFSVNKGLSWYIGSKARDFFIAEG